MSAWGSAWGNAWGSAWGSVEFNPSAMAGSAGFALTAVATLTAAGGNALAGSASFTFSAFCVLEVSGVLGALVPNRRPIGGDREQNLQAAERISIADSTRADRTGADRTTVASGSVRPTHSTTSRPTRSARTTR